MALLRFASSVASSTRRTYSSLLHAGRRRAPICSAVDRLADPRLFPLRSLTSDGRHFAVVHAPAAASCPSSARRTLFSGPTVPRWGQKTQVVMVPTMGDSITEGTIVEWTAKVGQAVKPDDVVALIETDKVTVEIKATMEGVITKQFGAVDDTVEVGAQLYEIDPEAEGTVEPAELVEASGFEAAAESVVAGESTEGAPPVPTAAHDTPSSHHRIPSIHFLQKDGWSKRKKGLPLETVVSAAAQKPPMATPVGAPPKSSSPLAVTTYSVDNLPPMYGRPKFTAAEMDAIMYGGANLLDA